jgi:hypothetical protein
MRGVMEFMNDLLGVSISLGTVHNIHQRAAQRAIVINDSVELSAIRVGLHDGKRQRILAITHFFSAQSPTECR